jgi:hypothetical protein
MERLGDRLQQINLERRIIERQRDHREREREREIEIP